jgi:hypothetical protein
MRKGLTVSTDLLPDPKPASQRKAGIPQWLLLTVLAVLPFVILKAKLRGVNDPDAFWHILSGQHVWRSRTVTGDDPFGTFSSNQWIQLDWLSDLWMAAAYAVGGLAGVAWVYSVLTILVFGAIYLACRGRAGILVSAAIATLGWIGASASLQFRPQTVSLVFLAITLWAWQRTLADGRPRYWLVALGWVWACSHGLWFLGPAVGVLVILGAFLDGSRDLRQLGKYALVPIGGLLAALLTPVGPQLLVLPFTVNSYAALVSEYAPPDVHEPFVAATVALLVITGVGWARSSSRVSWGDVLMWLTGVGFSLLYGRTVAIGAILLAPLAAGQLQRALRGPPETAQRVERVVLVGSMALAGVLGGLMAPSLAGEAGRMPTSLNAGIDQLPPGTVVFNDDAIGGWLLLDHPGLRPIVDTRTYLFTYDYLKAYKEARTTRGDWRGFLDDTGAEAALLRNGEALTEALVADSNWQVKAQDDRYVLLVRH